MSGLALAWLGASITWVAWAAAAAEPHSAQCFLGDWVRVERQRDDGARLAEIDRVTESKPFAFRRVARAVMRRRMNPVDRYEIGYDGRTFWIRSKAGERYPLDGRSRAGIDVDSVTSWVETA